MQDQGAAPVIYRALMRPSGRAFEARADRSLLASANAGGLDLPSSCRNGSCRTCLKPLHAGTVHYRIPWPGLLPEERHSGAWVLPCVAFPSSDVVIGD
ncbi:MAG: ferredoxin [Ramlibacter sp.]|nr:ferredoxin [Ramlibacter sp.]MDB5915125.1 ferredoxin [Ramlibacter sp.]